MHTPGKVLVFVAHIKLHVMTADTLCAVMQGGCLSIATTRLYECNLEAWIRISKARFFCFEFGFNATKAYLRRAP